MMMETRGLRKSFGDHVVPGGIDLVGCLWAWAVYNRGFVK
jgi:hypothetical protein